jgi:sodium pump decarboxylase gamma subunit
MGWVHDLGQGAVITTLGMAVTFGFLAVLILAIQLSSKIILKYNAEAELKKNITERSVQAAENGALIAAITIAVKKYRNDKKIKES